MPRVSRAARGGASGPDGLTTPQRAAQRDLVRVLEVGAHRKPARKPGDHHVRRTFAQGVGQVERRGLAGRRRVRGDHDLADARAVVHAAEQLWHVQVLGIDAVDRRQRTAEHVIAALELPRALDRDHVARLLHHTDRGRLAPLVLADAAGGLGGEVEADLALAHRGLHLTDGVGQPERLLIGDAEDVEGQPLRGALPDPGQASELGDEPVDGCCEQGRQRLAARAAEPPRARVSRARPGHLGRQARLLPRSSSMPPAPGRSGSPR